MSKKICIHLANGFEEVEAVVSADILRRAGYNVLLVSTTGERIVKGAHDIAVVADELIENVDYSNVDMMLLPGGMPGTSNLDTCQLLKDNLLSFYKNKKWIAAICAAPMILGKMGILKNVTATCYPGFEQYLQNAFVTSRDVEVSDNFITARGIGAAIKFALVIVQIFSGKELAERLASDMVVE